MTSLKFIEIPIYSNNPAGNPTAGFIGLYPKADGLYMFISSTVKKNVVLDQVMGSLTADPDPIVDADTLKAVIQKLLYQLELAVGGGFLKNSEDIQENSSLWLDSFLAVGPVDDTDIDSMLFRIYGGGRFSGDLEARIFKAKYIELNNIDAQEGILSLLRNTTFSSSRLFKSSLLTIPADGYEFAHRLSSSDGGSIILMEDGRVIIGGDFELIPPDPEDPESVETKVEILPVPRAERHQVFGTGFYEGTVKGAPAVETDEFVVKAQLQTITVDAVEPISPKEGDIWIEP